MRKMFFIILIFSLTNVSFATEAKIKRWDELMKLVTKEMKILENAKRKSPDLYYRMLELHSEKLKLIHEKNNRTFMERSKSANVNKNKESFFAETRAYYNLTKDFGNKLLRNNAKGNHRAEILYAMD